MTNYAFGILPTIIRQDSRVSDFACRLYSEVDSLSNKFGYCFATNSALGKALGKAPGTISRTLAELESFNYVNLVIEDGFKRKIYPKRDFREFEWVDEFEQGGNQKRLGGCSELSRGVIKNGMTANKNNLLRKPIKNNIEPQKEISIQVNEEFEGMKLIVHDTIPSTQEQTPTPNSAAPPSPRKAKREKTQVYKIFPPTLEEVIPLMYAKLVEKKRVHTNIVDCWNNANMQAEKFILHHEGKGWKIERLNSAIALWVNNAIGYGQVTKPCPIQYKGNPANAQPAQPTKPHVEERPVLTQHDIEYSQAAFASVEAMFKQMGV